MTLLLKKSRDFRCKIHGVAPNCRRLATAFFFVFFALAYSSLNGSEPKKTYSRREENVEGWRVFVDERLFEPENQALGERVLRLTADGLYRVATTLPQDRVDSLRQVSIFLDLEHGKLTSPQYHPSEEWLTANGYEKELAKSVHLPNASVFAAAELQRDQPCVLLHELSHAYHDRFLPDGFENAAIRRLWERAVEEKRYVETLHIGGGKTAHYALTNPQEFFAEFSETYFGCNDFYPFVRGELSCDYPEVFELIRALWETPTEGRSKTDD